MCYWHIKDNTLWFSVPIPEHRRRAGGTPQALYDGALSILAKSDTPKPPEHFLLCFPPLVLSQFPDSPPERRCRGQGWLGSLGIVGKLFHIMVLAVCFFSLLYCARAESWWKRLDPLAHIHRAGALFPSSCAPKGHPWWSQVLVPGLSMLPGAGMPKQYLGQLHRQTCRVPRVRSSHTTQSKAGM